MDRVLAVWDSVCVGSYGWIDGSLKAGTMLYSLRYSTCHTVYFK